MTDAFHLNETAFQVMYLKLTGLLQTQERKNVLLGEADYNASNSKCPQLKKRFPNSVPSSQKPKYCTGNLKGSYYCQSSFEWI